MDSSKILLSAFLIFSLNVGFITCQYLHPGLIHPIHPIHPIYPIHPIHHFHHHHHHHPHVEYIPVLREAGPNNDESIEDMSRSNENEEDFTPKDQHFQFHPVHDEMNRMNTDFQPEHRVLETPFQQDQMNEDNFQLVDGHMLQPGMHPQFQMRLANKVENFPTFEQMSPSNFASNSPNPQMRTSDLNTGEVENFNDNFHQPIFPPSHEQFLMQQPFQNQHFMNTPNHMSMRSNEDIFADSMIPMEELSMFSNNRNMEIPNSKAFPFDQFRQSQFMVSPEQHMQQAQFPQQVANDFSPMQPQINLATQHQPSTEKNPLKPENLSQEITNSNVNKMRKSSDMISQTSRITLPVLSDSSFVSVDLNSATNETEFKTQDVMTTTSTTENIPSDVNSLTNSVQINNTDSDLNKKTAIEAVTSSAFITTTMKNSAEKSRMVDLKINETDSLDATKNLTTGTNSTLKDLKNSATNINSNTLEIQSTTSSTTKVKATETTTPTTTTISSNKLRADQADLSSSESEESKEQKTTTIEPFSTTPTTIFSSSEDEELTTEAFTTITSETKSFKPPKKFNNKSTKFNKKSQVRVADDPSDQAAHAESENAKVDLDEEPNELKPSTILPMNRDAGNDEEPNDLSPSTVMPSDRKVTEVKATDTSKSSHQSTGDDEEPNDLTPSTIMPSDRKVTEVKVMNTSNTSKSSHRSTGDDEEPNDLTPSTIMPSDRNAAEVKNADTSKSKKTAEIRTTKMISTDTKTTTETTIIPETTTQVNEKSRSSELHPIISNEPPHPTAHLIPPHENFPPNNVQQNQQIVSPASIPQPQSVQFIPLEQHIVPIPSHIPHVQPVHILPVNPQSHFIETSHVPHVQPVHIFGAHSEVVPIHIIEGNHIADDPNYNNRRHEDDIERTAHIIKQKFISTPFGTPFGSFGGPQFIGQPTFGQSIPFQSTIPISQPQLVHSNGFPGVSNFGVTSSSSSSSTSFNSVKDNAFGFREAEENNSMSEKMAPETENSFPPIVGHFIDVPNRANREREHNIHKREISEKISTNSLIPVVQKIGSAFKNDPKATEAFHQVEDFLESFPISGNFGLEDSETGPEFSSGFTAKFPSFNGQTEDSESAASRSKRTLALLHLLGHSLTPTVRTAQPKISPIVHATNALGSVQQAAVGLLEPPLLGIVFPTQETIITQPDTSVSQAQPDSSPIVSDVSPSISQPKHAEQCPHQIVSAQQHQQPMTYVSPHETFANLHNFLMSAREAFANIRSQQESIRGSKKSSLKSSQNLGVGNVQFEPMMPMMEDSSLPMRSAENSPMLILRPVGRPRSRPSRRMYFVAEPFNGNMPMERSNPIPQMMTQESNIMLEPVNLPQRSMELVNPQPEIVEPVNIPRQTVEPMKRPTKRRKLSHTLSKALPEGSIVGRIVQNSHRNSLDFDKVVGTTINAHSLMVTEKPVIEPTPSSPLPNDATSLKIELNENEQKVEAVQENERNMQPNSDENKIENDDLEISNSNLEPQIVKMVDNSSRADEMNSPVVASFFNDMKEKMGNLMESFQKMASNQDSPKVQCVLPQGVVSMQPNPNFNQEVNSNSIAEPSADGSPKVGSPGIYDLPMFKPFGGHASDIQIHNYLEQFHQNPDANVNPGSYYDPPGIRTSRSFSIDNNLVQSMEAQ